jgi:flagellar basal-body rod protein FlgB
MIDNTHISGDLADRTMKSVEYALAGLAARADVRANNIANEETPGFLAKRLDFETSLKSALQDGGVDELRAQDLNGPKAFHKALRNTIPDPHGNSVNLELETTEMTKDNLMVQALVNGYNYKVGLLRSAISGGR